MTSRLVHRWMVRVALLGLISVVMGSAGCNSNHGEWTPVGQRVYELVEPSPRAHYLRALEKSSEGEPGLTAWTRAGEAALQNPWPVTAPFREAVWLEGSGPAVAYRFPAKLGQRLRFIVTLPEGDRFPLFVELFGALSDPTREEPSPLAELRLEPPASPVALPHATPIAAVISSPVQSSLSRPPAWKLEQNERLGEARATLSGDKLELEIVPPYGGLFTLRLQPERGQTGRITVEGSTGPSLGFPVADQTSRDIQSVWGDVRDGGQRRHQGVDAFAPRGQRVLAASDGYVSSVGESRLGGKVVWLWSDEHGHAQYYAHLDTQLVIPGQEVKQGDLLGTVGNTGNARSTAPHLHFGIYGRGGAVDPYPFLHDPPRPEVSIRASLEPLGGSATVVRKQAVVRGLEPEIVTIPGKRVKRKGRWTMTPARQRTEVPILATLTRGAAVRIIAASGNRYRVLLPDGRTGLVDANAVKYTPAVASA